MKVTLSSWPLQITGASVTIEKHGPYYARVYHILAASPVQSRQIPEGEGESLLSSEAKKDSPAKTHPHQAARPHPGKLKAVGQTQPYPTKSPGNSGFGQAKGPKSRNPKPTFVLVHGIGMSARYFLPLARHLRQYGNVILIDLPGFSTLPKPIRPLSIPGFAAVLHQTLRRNQVKNPIILGHSMGAQFVIELGARCPQLANRLLLLGAPVDVSAPTLAQVGIRFARCCLYEPPQLSALAIRAYLACGARWFLEILPEMMRYPLLDKLPKLRGQIVLAHGQHDAVAPLTWLQSMSQRMEQAEVSLATISHAAHSVMHAHPGIVAYHLVSLAARPPLNAAVGYQTCTGQIQQALAQASGEELIAAKSWWLGGTDTRFGALLDKVRAVADTGLSMGEKALSLGLWAFTAVPDYALFSKQTLLSFQPGLNRRVGLAEEAGRSDKDLPAVLLLHGMAESSASLRQLEKQIRQAGYQTFTVTDLGQMYRPLAELVPIAQQVLTRQILSADPGRKIVCVAHSKGGLLAKLLMLKYPQNVQGIISLGTPWSGSTLTRLVPWASWAKELSPDSSTIKNLLAQSQLNQRIVSLGALRDQQVPNGTWLAGATNQQLPLRGHQRLLEHPVALAAVLEHLQLLSNQ